MLERSGRSSTWRLVVKREYFSEGFTGDAMAMGLFGVRVGSSGPVVLSAWRVCYIDHGYGDLKTDVSRVRS